MHARTHSSCTPARNTPQVELLASNASHMSTLFANRGNQIIADKMLSIADIKLHSQNKSLKMSRGSFKVLNQHTAFVWLQVRGAGPYQQGSHSRASQHVAVTVIAGGASSCITKGTSAGCRQHCQARCRLLRPATVRQSGCAAL
jgi:hypothetical protein